jgi:hypothetical protein
MNCVAQSRLLSVAWMWIAVADFDWGVPKITPWRLVGGYTSLHTHTHTHTHTHMCIYIYIHLHNYFIICMHDMIIIQYMRKPLQTSQSNGVTAKLWPKYFSVVQRGLLNVWGDVVTWVVSILS